MPLLFIGDITGEQLFRLFSQALPSPNSSAWGTMLNT